MLTFKSTILGYVIGGYTLFYYSALLLTLFEMSKAVLFNNLLN